MSSMNIAYKYQGSLYVNLTNRCTNKCKFCIRFTPSGVDNIDLWLEHEPSVQEIIDALESADFTSYDEIVFCGYGEPLLRVYDVLEVCKFIKSKKNIKIRVNTNGHANRFAGEDVTPHMKGLIDVISISLNAENAQKYNEICVCDYGEEGFYEMLNFARAAKEHVPEVILSIVDVISKEEIEACRKIAEDIGVTFRVRTYSE